MFRPRRSLLGNWHDRLWSIGGLILTALYILRLILHEIRRLWR